MKIDLDYLEDCNRARPNWSPEDGVASSFVEFLILVNTPLGYIWIVILALFLWKRSILTGFLMALGSLVLLANWIAMYEINDDFYLGRLGGCVGSLSITTAVFLAASLFGVAAIGARVYKR
jgi:hypothetical protein